MQFIKQKLHLDYFFVKYLFLFLPLWGFELRAYHLNFFGSRVPRLYQNKDIKYSSASDANNIHTPC